MLWSFAVARPLFEVLQDAPEFFVARGNTSADIVVFALLLVLVAPTLMLLCEAALFRLPRARRALHLAFVALLVAAIVLQVIGDWGAPGAFLVAGSLVAGGLGALAYARTRIAPTALSVLAPAPILFLAIFLLLSPVSDLVLPRAEGEAISAEVRSRTPVVLVVFDEFAASALHDRHGRIDASRFPHFAALAQDATWYRNAWAAADETTRAVPALLSGGLAPKGQLATASEYPRNLFTLLGDSYSLDVDEPITNLCPARLCGDTETRTGDRLRALFDDLSVVSAYLLLPSDLDDGLPPVDRTFGGFRRAGRDQPGAAKSPGSADAAFENRVGRFNRFLRGLRDTADKPQLDFLHLELPHVPWQYLPSSQSYPVSGPDTPGLKEESWSEEPWPPAQGYQRYLLQLGFVDRLVGRTMKRLHDAGLYERALVVVTADHGVSFQAGGSRRGLSVFNIADIANVPLFIKAPGQRVGRIDNGAARTIDILPTIADTLHLRLPGEVDGRPLGRGAVSDAIRVGSYGGDDVRLPFADFVRLRDAEVRRRIGLFGAGDGFAGVFAAVSDRALIGTSARALRTGGEAPFRVEFDTPSAYSTFTPGATEVPAFVTGRLAGSVTAGEEIAVAVNGRVAAVTRSYSDGDTLRMAAMVPPTAFRKGANDVEALAVSGSGPDARLVSLGRAESQGATLASRDGKLAVVPAQGAEIAVVPRAADGFIDSVRVEGNRLTVSGWASDAGHNRPADRVYLFAGDRLLAAGSVAVARRDLVKGFGPGLAQAGYAFTAIGDPEATANPGRVRVFAVVDGRASELRPSFDEAPSE